ncbi:MAG: RluA family pseudouridine synthase, partial [Candidatus Absconditabacterales bacterium]
MEIIIDKTNADQRFDRFLRKRFKIYPKVRLADIYALIRRGSAKVNKKKQKEQYRLNIGDLVSIDEHVTLGDADFSVLTSGKEKQLEKVDIRKIQDRILYTDQHWIVFDKPAGILVHPGNNHWKDLSMNDYLEKIAGSMIQDAGCKMHAVGSPLSAVTFKPSFGYRLDKDTSGVLIAGKTYDALQYINKLIRERQIDKYYLALVVGKFPDHLLIDKPLEKQYNERFNKAEVKVDFRYGVTAKTECWCEKFFTHAILGECSLVK